uniref:Uncharacterized protein n=1 Tax=Pristionchus pacificus TaxID=54126 RepID=A0A2A6C9F2_PRIPA|eukprot:PDM74757.1 hypothetical protein PRIPAC_43708 [Pristionchus pacificus]
MKWEGMPPPPPPPGGPAAAAAGMPIPEEPGCCGCCCGHRTHMGTRRDRPSSGYRMHDGRVATTGRDSCRHLSLLLGHVLLESRLSLFRWQHPAIETIDAAACRAGTYHPVQPPAAAGTFAAAAVEPSSSAIYIIDR